MELICTEAYNDIRFSLQEGDSTELIPYLTDEFKESLLRDYPEKFKLKPTPKAPKASEVVVETKEDKLEKKVTKK